MDEGKSSYAIVRTFQPRKMQQVVNFVSGIQKHARICSVSSPTQIRLIAARSLKAYSSSESDSDDDDKKKKPKKRKEKKKQEEKTKKKKRKEKKR